MSRVSWLQNNPENASNERATLAPPPAYTMARFWKILSNINSLGTVHLLRKGKRVGGWSGKTLIFPYIGGYIVQDDSYVSISFQELCQINCLASSNLMKLFWFLTNILLGKLKTNVSEYTSSFCKIDVDFCKLGYFRKVSSKSGSINQVLSSIDIMKER